MKLLNKLSLLFKRPAKPLTEAQRQKRRDESAKRIVQLILMRSRQWTSILNT